MKNLRCIYLLLMCLFVSQMALHSQNRMEVNYKLRCDSVINYYASNGAPHSLFSVMAKYASGKAGPSTGILLDSLLEHPSGNMFWMYPVTGIYFYGRNNLSQAQKDRVMKAFAHYKADTGITENHKLMFYASVFLMSAEESTDTVKWFNDKSSYANNEFAGKMLKAWMNKAFANGFAEFNSPHYGGFYLSPLLMLYEFSRDREIQVHAGMLLSRILGDYSLHYRSSTIGGAASRVVDEDIFNKKSTAMAQLMGFLLGDKPANANYHTLFFALSSFIFPQTLITMWKEAQKQDFELMDAERSMTKLNVKSESLTSYFYSDSLFTLGSVIDGHDDEIQTRTWSLDWAGTGKNNSLFGLNPYMSKAALAEYFPGNADTMYKNILKQRPFYNDTNKWIGASPYENLFQYKNVLLGIYNFPDTLKNNSVSFFVSKDLDSMLMENNTLCARTGSIYYALRFSESPVVSNAEYGKRYRIRNKKPSFVLEVYPIYTYQSLNDFCKMIKKESVSLSSKGIKYKGVDGAEMKLNVSGEKFFNGKPFVINRDTIYQSPFMKVYKGIMTIKTSQETLMFDWDKQQVTSRKNEE